MPKSDHQVDEDAGAETPPHVFISYSHGSAAHDARVLGLAGRLRAEGVDCHLDAFEEAPPEGWPAWMHGQVRNARYVIAVCTESYQRRVTQQERQGVGLGARWEGALITQAIYEAGGRNSKFIPVVFESDDVRHIPGFLQSTTRYDVSAEEGYTALYRRLTQQPKVERPALGPRRTLPPEYVATEPRTSRSSESGVISHRESGKAVSSASGPPTGGGSEPVLIDSGDEHPFFVPALAVDAGDDVVLTLVPNDPATRAFLEDLGKGRGQPVGVAYGLTAFEGHVRAITHSRVAGQDQFKAVLNRNPDRTGGITEVGTTGYSADDIATLRARRILLDEVLDARAGGLRGILPKNTTLEGLVRGMSTKHPVKRSPLPGLFKQMKTEPRQQFLSAALLTVVYWLRQTGTVEHVLDLDLRFTDETTVSVRFRGRRRKFYTNQPAVEIVFAGTLQLYE